MNPLSQTQVQADALSPPTQNQQISKSTIYIYIYSYTCYMIKYSIWGKILWQIQLLVSPHAVFVTQPHPSCCILLYNTRKGALTSSYVYVAFNHWSIKQHCPVCPATTATKNTCMHIIARITNVQLEPFIIIEKPTNCFKNIILNLVQNRSLYFRRLNPLY